MNFVTRLGISLAISSLIPVLLIHQAQAHAYETDFLFGYAFAWLFLIPLSLYSSPTVAVIRDSSGAPVPIFASYAKRRAAIGVFIGVSSLAVFLLDVIFSTFEFERRFGWFVMGPLLAVGPAGGYILLTSMCPYCRKLNRPNLCECANCGNPLPPHWVQRYAKRYAE